MNSLKSQKIQHMKTGGKKLAAIRDELISLVKPGVVPLDIDAIATKRIKEAGGKASFLTVSGYKWATCISVNDGVVHGVPDKRPFVAGDVVSIDIGLFYEGYHTDTSWSVLIEDPNDKSGSIKKSAFLTTGKTALEKAIKQAKSGLRIGHISQAMQKEVEGAGFSIVPSLVGHGIGKNLHEAPQIPGVLNGRLERTMLLKEGMTIAIEVIYTMGKPHIQYSNDDGWTLATVDGSLAGLFEETVLITTDDPLVLTQSQT